MLKLLLIPQTFPGPPSSQETVPDGFLGSQYVYNDSIFIGTDTISKMSEPGSFFTGHLMKPGHNLQTEERTALPGDWIFLTLLVAVTILTLAKLGNARKLSALFQSVFSRPAEILMLREGAINRDRIFIPLFAVYLISIASFLYLVFNYLFDPSYFDLHPLGIFSLFLLGAFIAIMVKFLLMRLTGSLFRNKKITREYIHNILIFNLFTGIVLIPLLFLSAYSDKNIFILLTSGILLVLLVYRFIRGMIIGFEDTNFSVFHLFLYLCSFEILPLIVATKIVTDAIALQA